MSDERLTEGMIKKGGVNEKPISPKKDIRPPAQCPPAIPTMAESLDKMEELMAMLTLKVNSLQSNIRLIITQRDILRERVSKLEEECQGLRDLTCPHCASLASRDGEILALKIKLGDIK